MSGSVCTGCIGFRRKGGFRHKSKAKHECLGGNCACGSCNPWKPVTDEQYRTWMAKLGGFYIDNTKILVKTLKGEPIKKEPSK